MNSVHFCIYNATHDSVMPEIVYLVQSISMPACRKKFDMGIIEMLVVDARELADENQSPIA